MAGGYPLFVGVDRDGDRLRSLEIVAAWLAQIGIQGTPRKKPPDALANERIVFLPTPPEYQHVQTAQHGDQARSRARCVAVKRQR